MKFKLIPLVILLVAGAFYLSQPTKQGKELPPPTNGTIVFESAEEGENQDKRAAWIESMHQTAPGTNWRSIEDQTAFQKYENHLRQRKEAANRSSDCAYANFSNGSIRGQWRERGSSNQAGNILVTAVEAATETIFAISGGGSLWKGNIEGKNWIPQNQDLRFGNRFLELIPTSNGRRLIGIIGGEPYYSDDDGLTWEASGGVSATENSDTRKGDVIMVNGEPVIYLLSKENNWADLKLYESTDLGENYSVVHTFSSTSNWSRLDMDKIKGSEQLVFFHTTNSRTEVYHLSDTEDFNLKLEFNEFQYFGTQNIPSNVTAVDVDGTSRLFSYDRDRQVWMTENFGESWEKRGTLPTRPWEVGLYVTQQNPDLLLYGEVECYRSTDGGNEFVRINTWGAYYANVATKLHADIMHFNEIIDADGLNFITISNHGGLSVSIDETVNNSNIGTFGLNVSQYYDVATDPTDHQTIYAGSQDQGFQRATSTNTDKPLKFDQVISGDYGHIAFSENGKRMWMVYPGGSISYYSDPINGNNEAGWTLDSQNETVWIPPLVTGPDPSKNEVYLAGGNPTGGAGSFLIKLGIEGVPGLSIITQETHHFDFYDNSVGGEISYIAFSPINPDHWYVSTNNGRFFYSTDGGETFDQNPEFLVGGHYLYGAAIHPSEVDENTVYFGGSGYSNPAVYVSTNNGLSFVPMSEGLPSTLVFELDGNEDDSQIYAATEAGPYVFNQEDQRWYDLATTCTPNQTYWSVEYLEESETARFGTYGRGIWDLSLGVAVATENPKIVHEGLKVFPNPSNGPIQVVIPQDLKGQNKLEVRSMDGRLVKEVNLEDGVHQQQLDLQHLAKGTYQISIQSKTHRYSNQLILQ